MKAKKSNAGVTWYLYQKSFSKTKAVQSHLIYNHKSKEKEKLNKEALSHSFLPNLTTACFSVLRKST